MRSYGLTRRMRGSAPAACCLALIVAALGPAGAGLVGEPAGNAQSEQAEVDQVRPLLRRFCGGCHGAQQPQAGLNLDAFATVPALQRDQETWRAVLTRIREGSMPPPGQARPDDAERERLAAWLQRILDAVDDRVISPDPGHTVLRRLSRSEYGNTVRDLFGIDARIADRFPPDGGGGAGFDNNAATLFLPPLLMERYLEVAAEVLARVRTDRLLIARPDRDLPAREAARRVVVHWATRAYRRPVEAGEVDRLLGLYDQAAAQGAAVVAAVKLALKAVLVSPSFLFRVEAEEAGPAPTRVGDQELASRLSYFLWSSLPDEELFRLAQEGRLGEPEVLAGQVRRMLLDPKARALAENFGGQWLRVRELETTARPDPTRFPAYTPALRDAMVGEALEFLHALLREDDSLLDLLDADYSYLNEALSRHYGVPGVNGAELRQVSLPDRRRGGLVTMAGVLTATSYPLRTSPVLRGKWVLEELLGVTVPPPPADAGTLPKDDRSVEELTLRQRLEQHRQRPACHSCHSRIDPVGFSLENYDPTGRWRSEVGGQPVDASGQMPTGETFSGPVELKRYLLARRDDFLHNLAEKMLAYALGRGLEWYDRSAVRKITAAVARDGYRAGTLVREVALSYPFQYRRGSDE